MHNFTNNKIGRSLINYKKYQKNPFSRNIDFLNDSDKSISVISNQQESFKNRSFSQTSIKNFNYFDSNKKLKELNLSSNKIKMNNFIPNRKQYKNTQNITKRYNSVIKVSSLNQKNWTPVNKIIKKSVKNNKTLYNDSNFPTKYKSNQNLHKNVNIQKIKSNEASDEYSYLKNKQPKHSITHKVRIIKRSISRDKTKIGSVQVLNKKIISRSLTRLNNHKFNQSDSSNNSSSKGKNNLTKNKTQKYLNIHKTNNQNIKKKNEKFLNSSYKQNFSGSNPYDDYNYDYGKSRIKRNLTQSRIISDNFDRKLWRNSHVYN